MKPNQTLLTAGILSLGLTLTACSGSNEDTADGSDQELTAGVIGLTSDA